MERRFIRERQQAGIEAAKAKGIYKGRKPSVPVERVRAMRDAGHGPTVIAKALGISRGQVTIISGATSRNKRVAIPFGADELARRLADRKGE